MEDDDVKLEEEINIELSRISVTSLEVDDLNTDLSAEAWSDGETTSDELPESVLYCLNVVKNRSQNAENLILQDLEDEETTSDIYRVVSSQASEYLAELASEYNEDPDTLKKRILSEIENEELQTRATSDSNSQPISEDITCRVVADERSVTGNGDMTISFTYHEVEERCRQEFELWEERQKELEDQKRKQLKAEREIKEKQSEEEKKRRQLYLEEFEAERMKLEMLHKQQQAMMEDELLKEKEVWREKFRQHEELIKRLQLQIEEEKRAFEEQKAKERQHLAEQWNKAAVKIQARFRAFIIYRKYAPILKEWKAEIKRKKELQQKMEREKREKEEKMRRRMQERKQKEEELRKRQEEIERQAHMEQVTTLTLQDLPGCSLSTLSECSSLQLLTLRRCGLTALEGLSNCKGLKYIDVEENNIQTINCENLENLCILILNKNQLASIHGLDGCSDLRNLELSCNKITRIGGLESLKNLQQLIVDHNQLISTKGLCDVPTLIHIDCSFNHLTQLEGIENCGLLQILKLQGNNLSELPTLENHVLLRELYLDDNSISTIETFSFYWLPLLQILSLSQNSLTQLVPLFSYVSLEKLNISNNCLSDLESVIIWFSGCQKLSELSLNGNPVLQEKNWRCSLLKILPILQFLNGENLNSPEKLSTERIKESEPGSFLKFCQAQIEEIDLIKKKTIEQGNASSLDAAQSQCWYFKELMKLSNEHRYAHEYGDLNIADRDEPEAQQDHLKQTATDSLQQNNLFIAGAKENKQGLLNPSERWITTGHIQPMCINSSVPVPQKKSNQEHKIKKKSIECYISHKGESKDNSKISTPTTRNTFRETIIASNEGENLQHAEYSVENLAATLIQSYWRGYIIRRDINFCARLHTAASEIQCAWRKYLARRNAVCCKKESNELTVAIEQKHKAAALIQAFWKGFLLRKKLASALAAIKSDEVEDDYEEVNVDDFTFDEAALEREWLALDSTRFPSKTLLLTNQLHWPKYARPLSSDHNSFNLTWPPHEAWQCDERPHSLSSENTPFSTRLEKRAMSRLSDLQPKKKFSFKSEKEEKISEEWGFKDIATAQLMLKRAHKMKSKKSSTKNLDPAVRLALFRNNENKHPPVKPSRKRQPAKETASSYFEGREEDFVHLDTTSAEKLQRSKELTYRWLHTQVGDCEATGLRNIKCNRFLPDLDPDILNGGRVQLVASPVSREDTDLDLISMISGSALTQNREKNNQPRRNSAGCSTKDISASERTHVGPFRKERISFRDHPVQLSGGWGSGKKKAKSLKN
ncbi:leucine-rich repeat and IQ domain-containing protein 1 isoform X4 [Gopherus flavomarginatus]|uniref:leucine-rich repeat and IQ domain-containing protein 1 isoform X4 n=1 Tax=Gopherus flavomarginatus TaxID=286002 RepID=UPI0021CBDB9B|nr:leucine-rich repeat and IQ domain-containing protein 1 isoform X4 [Gopherus flavomarginatus]